MRIFRSPIFICLVGFCSIWLIFYTIFSIIFGDWRSETTNDVAIVVSKDATDAHALAMAKPTLPMFLAAGMLSRYDVCVLYKGEEHCFNDPSLYEKVKIGDTVRISIRKTFNGRNELIDTLIRLED